MEVTGTGCQTEEQQIDYIEKQLSLCAKRNSVIAKVVSSDDLSVCSFYVATDRPTIESERIFKGLETEGMTTILSTGYLIASESKLMKVFETEAYTTMVSSGQMMITKVKEFKDIITEADTTELATGGDILAQTRLFKLVSTETYWTTLATTVIEHTKEFTLTDATKEFETTTLSTSLIEDIKEIDVMKTVKRFETTTQPARHSECGRKIARTYLKLDDSYEADSYSFKQFEKLFDKQCHTNYLRITDYVKTSIKNRCTGSSQTPSFVSTSETSVKEKSGE